VSDLAEAEPTELVEVIPESVAAPVRRFGEHHPRAAAAYAHARPFLRTALHGVAFAGGALLLARLFGVRIADRLGERGGQSFARGVVEGQQAVARLERGARFG
jgi:hypothetical protein